MNKIIYPLSPCPWCKQLPSIKFYFERETWMPRIVCENDLCNVNPESIPAVIRKTCKIDLERLKKKIGDLFDCWNTGNPILATEGKEIDFDQIVEQGKREEDERKNLSID